MRNFFLLVAVLLIAAPSSLAEGQDFWNPFGPTTSVEDTPDILNPKWDEAEWQPYHESLVHVECGSCRGSGVIVRVEDELIEIETDGKTASFHVGYIMTCCHVALGSNTPDGYLIKYTNKAKIKASLVWFDHDLDVAVLKTLVPERYSAVKIATGFVEDGDVLVGVGLGGRKPRIENKDTIRRFKITASKMTGRNWIRSDECLIPGDSGGPLFNSDGELVGLHCMGHESFCKPFQDRVVWPAIFVGPASVRKAMKGIPQMDSQPK